MQEQPRPYVRAVPVRPGPPYRQRLACGWRAFAEVEVLRRGRLPERLPVEAATTLYPEAAGALARIEGIRPPLAGIPLDRPVVMGIVNVTPDSFSDGGLHAGTAAAVRHALALAGAGADIVDIGGESTRPGSDAVPAEAEIARVVPVIKRLVAEGIGVISVDTRKAAVAAAALRAGARIINDVSALAYDPGMAAVARDADGLCLMHMAGEPKTMQDDPRYDDVLLDVFDALERRISLAEQAGIPRDRLVADPGIGFGKTLDHNLALIRRLSLFHALGVPVLLGASRKRFIGTIGGEPEALRRDPGSLAATLAGWNEGVQISRVHDVAGTTQATRLWRAIEEGEGWDASSSELMEFGGVPTATR